jgi:LAO/AO transport system kinase
MDIVDKVLAGDVRSAARVMTWVENGMAEAVSALKRLFPHTGRGFVVGVTGPPGSGKSTLVDRLTGEFRRLGKTVGIVAVDPSSPFSGGAILADRVRMQRHSLDEEIFIRSMANRGHLGGLSRTTNDVVDVMDAMGKEIILVETVGVGQDEIEIVRTAHTCLVVAVPGLGDDIQAIKAGIMEIGDLFVVNKADRDGAERTYAEIEGIIRQSRTGRGWRPRIFKTMAVKNEGIEELARGIQEHQRFLEAGSGTSRKVRDRSEAVLWALLEERLLTRVRERIVAGCAFDELVDLIAARRVDPYTAVEQVLVCLGLPPEPAPLPRLTDILPTD